MTEREALKMALEALELAGGNLCEALHHPKKLQHGIDEPCPAVAKYDKAITAIKEALAQPEQEPVAWVSSEELLVMRGNALGGAKDWRINVGLVKQNGDVGLYTTPPQRKPLSDEEARFEFEAWHKDAYTQSLERYGHTYKNHHTRCRWQGWLAAHGIKGEA